MDERYHNWAIIIAFVIVVFSVLSLIFIYEFSSPDGSFRKAIGECGDGFCQKFEVGNCPVDCENTGTPSTGS